MTDNVDELTRLELIAAFARAMGHKAIIVNPKDGNPYVWVETPNKSFGLIELPADLILREFNRLGPSVRYNASGITLRYNRAGKTYEGIGPSLEIAQARLSVKLSKESK